MKIQHKSFQFSILVFLSLSLSGCGFRYVADYNSALSDEIIRVAKKVDFFYAILQNMPDSLRTFDKSVGQYTEIEVDLNSIVMRNKIRPLNSESTKIAETALSFWCKYKDMHKKENTYKNAKIVLHRKRMGRVFSAMFNAEEAKKMNPSDSE
jgi:hypothetical protein